MEQSNVALPEPPYARRPSYVALIYSGDVYRVHLRSNPYNSHTTLLAAQSHKVSSYTSYTNIP